MRIIPSIIQKSGRWSLALPFFYMAFVFTLSEVPGNKVPTWGIQCINLGNLLHFPEYFGLSLAWLVALEARQVPARRAGVLAVLLATGFGALDEVHQSFVPLRSMDIWDVAVDFAGAACASLTWAWTRPFFFPDSKSA